MLNKALTVPLVLLGVSLAWSALQAADVTRDRHQQLTHLLKHDCGSCHGLTLKGGLGPALTPVALRDKPTEVLRQTILQGRPGTPMPPFAGMLSTDEVDWLIASLRQGNIVDE